MNTGAIVATLVVIAVLILAALLVLFLMRRRRLQEKFGSEYQRAVETHDSRTAAERELREREKRHAELPIRPLPPDARDRYTTDWARVQEQFVDDPERAITEADRLVTALMADRGYPTEGYEQQVADLSVEHGKALEHYRAAHDTRLRTGNGDVPTEELRVAMVHYRTLFDELLEPADRAAPVSPGGQGAQPRPERQGAHARPDGRVDVPHDRGGADLPHDRGGADVRPESGETSGRHGRREAAR